jgi:hypothetical protein
MMMMNGIMYLIYTVNVNLYRLKGLYKAGKFLVRNHNNQQHNFISKIQSSNLQQISPDNNKQPTNRTSTTTNQEATPEEAK